MDINASEETFFERVGENLKSETDVFAYHPKSGMFCYGSHPQIEHMHLEKKLEQSFRVDESVDIHNIIKGYISGLYRAGSAVTMLVNHQIAFWEKETLESMINNISPLIEKELNCSLTVEYWIIKSAESDKAKRHSFKPPTDESFGRYSPDGD